LDSREIRRFLHRKFATMKPLLVLMLVAAWNAGAASDTTRAASLRLVNPYPSTGPLEISGSAPANKALRAMQAHAAPPLTDLVSRALQQSLAYALDTPVAVVRRAKRGGAEALEHVALVPDGRTLLLAGSDVIIVRNLLTGYDWRRDIKPVALIARMPNVLVGMPHGSDVRRVVESGIARSKRTLASSGELASSHLAGALFIRATGANIGHVAFNGAHSALRAVVAGEVTAAFVPLPAFLDYVRNARLRPQAIADDVRHPSLPDLITLSEAGLPSVSGAGWYGLFAPYAMPAQLINRTASIMAAEQDDARFSASMAQAGLRVERAKGPAFSNLIETDYGRWQAYLQARPEFAIPPAPEN